MSSLGLGLGVNRFFGRGQVTPLPDDFIIEVNTALAGVSNSDQFQFTGAVGEYDVEAYQNGDLVASFEDLVNEQTITLPSAGIYELRCIIKPAGFDKMTFDNGGDRLKLLKILNWGLYGVNQPNQASAFNSCENNTEIADNGAWFDVVTDGTRMFINNNLTSLPKEMNLPLLTNGDRMFFGNNFPSLPEGFVLANLTNGLRMFQQNSLTSLPEGMVLPNLTNGLRMFFDNNLTSLPSGMDLALLENGDTMFRDNSLASLPVGMELPLLTNGDRMFLNNTINTERYSQLLIDLEANNNNNNVEFHGGFSKYNAQGEIARNALIARGWTITDGGLEN